MKLKQAGREIIFGISGGSGAPLATRLLDHLIRIRQAKISLVVSEHALEVLRCEQGADWGSTFLQVRDAVRTRWPEANEILEVFDNADMAASISSGSHPADAMVIVPCSLSTLGAIAGGFTLNLIQRAASVSVKERRKLILVPRESPLSSIHLRNMLELAERGCDIVPATTAFYHKPASVEDMIDFTCMKIMDLLNLEHDLDKRWKGAEDALVRGAEAEGRCLAAGGGAPRHVETASLKST